MPKNGHALAIAEGIDRDRAVDESGNQIAVFGRVGARPLSLADQQKMYIHNGMLWQVSDDPRSPLYQRLPNSNLRSPVPSVSPPLPGTVPSPVRVPVAKPASPKISVNSDSKVQRTGTIPRLRN